MAKSFYDRLPPKWKVQRELRRLRTQFSRLLLRIGGRAIKLFHDATKPWRITLLEGQAPDRDDAAVYVIFQPKGILSSTLNTLRHLNEKGFAPLVVVNHPLAEDQIAKLRPLARQIMIRPNIGYDFGGYRDGILHLLKARPPKGQLLVLNDSIWFPIWDDCDLLDRFRASSADLHGVIYTDDPKVKQKPHIQSYMFRFGPDALRSPAFRRYWQRLGISNDRVLTIHDCEIPMTRRMQGMGFSFDVEYRTSLLNAQLQAADDDLLISVVRFQIALSERRAPPLREVHRKWRAGHPGWRTEAIDLIESHHSGRYLLMAHPEILFGQLRMPVLKKSRERRYLLQRKMAEEYGYLDRFLPVVAEEMAHWDDAVPGVADMLDRLRPEVAFPDDHR